MNKNLALKLIETPHNQTSKPIKPKNGTRERMFEPIEVSTRKKIQKYQNLDTPHPENIGEICKYAAMGSTALIS